MSLVVYTAISESYDELCAVPVQVRGQADWVAYLEHTKEFEPWNVRPLIREQADAVRDAKKYKILPHEFFPNHEYSLWVDGKMEFLPSFSPEKLLSSLKDCDLAVFQHANRHCAYEEACEAVLRRLDDPDLIYRQVQRYTQDGFLANRGLVDCAVLLRRNTPRMREFCQLWWHEIEKGSRRDQISFPYCAWKCGTQYKLLPGFAHRNPHFRCLKHLLPLNPLK